MRMPQLLHKLLRTRRNKDILLFILFFILAAALWYGHAMQTVRNARVPVYIAYQGLDGAYGFDQEALPEQLMIEVRDAGYQLNAYHSNPPTITINLLKEVKGDSGTIHISSTDLRSSIKAALRSNSSLIDIQPNEISYDYYKEYSKRVPLVFHGEITPAPGYQHINGIQFLSKFIDIYGKEDVIRTIDTIRTEFQSFTNIKEPIHEKIRIDLPRGIRAKKTDSIYCEIEPFTEAKFVVPIQASVNTPIHFFPSTVEVSVRIGSDHYDEIQASDFKATCELKAGALREFLPVELSYPKNPHITHVRCKPTEVEFLIEE